MDLNNQIAALQADLNNAHHVTYLTGAGVSTPVSYTHLTLPTT